jgi:D-threonine aldolase
MSNPWYSLENIEEIDSPCIVIFKDRVLENIGTLKQSIDNVDRLRPHIKTHKSPEVSAMMIREGITRFKCATIAEAEMLATCGAVDVLLAYQPVGPKVERMLELVVNFPSTGFSCLIDNLHSAKEIASAFHAGNATANVFIDLNVGMNRTGIAPSEAYDLWIKSSQLSGIKLLGLHAYDGHIRDEDFTVRKTRSDEAFKSVEDLAQKIKAISGTEPIIIAGGSPTFPVHAQRNVVECSPGTFIYWDKGYETILPEQHYLHAAVVVTRVISKPSPGVITTDLGHKSIASENPLTQRISFLNADDLEPIGHSEEHLVLKTKDSSTYKIGDILYGVPYHVCPTVALYERVAVASGGRVVGYWHTLARNRKITY